MNVDMSFEVEGMVSISYEQIFPEEESYLEKLLWPYVLSEEVFQAFGR